MNRSTQRVGTQLGPYEVVAPIGAGAMGEVYRTWDSRLNRAVALKILPHEFAEQPSRLARFEQEARIVASLNDPHVLSVFDIGCAADTHYFVSELLEGETLRARLNHRLKASVAIDIAIQLAAGLAAVHEAGVVHRDLKPENIFISKHNAVKILDFGIAQLGDANVRHDELAATDVFAPAPEGDHIIGTPAYASPEQLKGLPVDHRTDIFAFGTVLYEMLTGFRAFARGSRADTIDAVLSTDPLANAPNNRLDSWLEAIVSHCLEKEPERRFQSTRDLLFALESGKSVSDATARSQASRSVITWPLALSALLFFGAVLLLVFYTRRSETVPAGLATRTILPIRSGIAYAGGGIDVSPDGRRVALVAISDGQSRLYVREMLELEPQLIAGTEGASGPFFSPDGQWIGFFAAGKLKKVAVNGGPATTLASSELQNGGSWGPDDTILFTPSVSTGIWAVSASGSAARPVTAPNEAKDEKSHRSPQWLPGGRALLFHTHFSTISSLSDATIEVFVPETGERRALVDSGQNATYVAGHIVYLRDDNLMAAPFDLKLLALTSPPTPIAKHVVRSEWGVRNFGLSTNGLLIYAADSGPARTRQLVWVDREGRAMPIGGMNGTMLEPRLSEDGSKVAVRVAAANDQIWIYEFSRKLWSRLTYQWDSVSPVWTPDSSRLIVGSSRSGPWNLFAISSNDGGSVDRMKTSDRSQRPTSWSPDGLTLVYTETQPTTGDDIWTWRVGEASAKIFLRTPFAEGEARFSPDGRWIAYMSAVSGRPEVYVRSFNGPSGQWQISVEGGQWPVWAKDGSEIFYRTPLGSPTPLKLMSATVSAGSTFSSSEPKLLFDARQFGRFDVSLDGQRFLTVYSPPAPPTEIYVMTSWEAELKRH